MNRTDFTVNTKKNLKSERENIKKEYPVIKIKELLPNTIV